MSERFLEERALRQLRAPRDFRLSDLTSRRAVGFGITSEIGMIVPYDLPQAWAAKLSEMGAQGLRYWLRHDPARSEGIALFGRHGERKRWRRGREQAISRALVDRLRDVCGVEVLPVPSSGQLDFVDSS